jgi:hypothetical protein
VPAEITTDVLAHVSVPPVALAPGGAFCSFTEAVAVLVHPPADVVTVTVYVPVALTRGFAVVLPEMTPGPDQLKVTPPVLELAESTTEVVVQVSVPPVALAPGAVLFALTDAVVVLVHPPAEVVTVTVYVPVALTRGFAVVLPEMTPGPAQLKVTPPVPELAESTTEVVVQVSVPPVALPPGAVHPEGSTVLQPLIVT